MVGKVLKETLADKQYSGEDAKQWSKEISDTLLANLKGMTTCTVFIKTSCYVYMWLYTELELDRYKFVVQVVIGELRGEGVK